jgi:hypothetical protein
MPCLDSLDIVDVLPSLLPQMAADFRHKEIEHGMRHDRGYRPPQSAAALIDTVVMTGLRE